VPIITNRLLDDFDVGKLQNCKLQMAKLSLMLPKGQFLVSLLNVIQCTKITFPAGDLLINVRPSEVLATTCA
jgi:hypothetical protein